MAIYRVKEILIASLLLCLLFPPRPFAFEGSPNKEEHGTPEWSGKAVDIFSADIYKYVRVVLDGSGEEIWFSAVYFEVKKGDRIELLWGKRYTDFRSDLLDRTFPVLYSGWIFRVNDASYDFSAHSEDMNRATELLRKRKSQELNALLPKLGEIPKQEGVTSIGALIADMEKFNGKEVMIGAKVVKKSIMAGDTVILMMDGTGPYEYNYVTMRDFEALGVGDLVKVKGTLYFNVQRGLGHLMPLFFENPEIIDE